MPKRPSESDGMYKAQIMAATSYLPTASPYIVFNNHFFTLVRNFLIYNNKETSKTSIDKSSFLNYYGVTIGISVKI